LSFSPYFLLTGFVFSGFVDLQLGAGRSAHLSRLCLFVIYSWFYCAAEQALINGSCYSFVMNFLDLDFNMIMILFNLLSSILTWPQVFGTSKVVNSLKSHPACLR
jgi:hypothetical protein